MGKFMFVLVIVIAYFLGNISPSTMLGRASGVDIKKEGSGNAGTTNALRVLGKKAAVITLVVDILKGVIAVQIGFSLSSYTAGLWCAFAAFVGHVWPVVFKFKGGKGVAVAFGAIMSVNWQLGLIALGIVSIMVLITRMVSLGAVTAAVIFPVLCYFLESDFLPVSIMIVALLLYAHRENIVRIIKGEESKLEFKK